MKIREEKKRKPQTNTGAKNVKETIMSKMIGFNADLRRKEIEFRAGNSIAGKELCAALVTFLTSSGVQVRKVTAGVSYKDFELKFHTEKDTTDALALVQKIQKEKSFTVAKKVLSHNENDEDLKWWQIIGRGIGKAAHWATDTLDIMNDGQEAEANAMAAQAMAQAEIAKANAEAEKSKAGVYIGVGLGAVVLVVLLVLVMKKK